jgi:hypothetical protein
MLCNVNSTLLDYVAPQQQTHIGFFLTVALPYFLYLILLQLHDV